MHDTNHIYIYIIIIIIIVETSLNCFSHSKIMTAVASHLFLPELTGEMPPGSAKDILYGQTDRSASLR